MKKLVLLSTVALGMSFSYGVSACSKINTVNHAQKSQKLRIAKGVKSGELTRAEARLLKRQVKRVNKMRIKAIKDDGRIDRQERKQIQRAQSKLSKKIYIKKHNSRIRGV